MTLRFCLHCNSHHESGYSCPKREAKRYAASAARKARGRHAWRVARTAARQRDGNRCRRCGDTHRLQVHHIVSLDDGGAKYDLNNLITLCSSCHNARHRGDGGSTERGSSLPRASNPRETLQPRPRFSRSVLRSVLPDDEAPLIG
jgi:5-methylcytosine-specific restriction enzyme A